MTKRQLCISHVNARSHSVWLTLPGQLNTPASIGVAIVWETFYCPPRFHCNWRFDPYNGRIRRYHGPVRGKPSRKIHSKGVKGCHPTLGSSLSCDPVPDTCVYSCHVAFLIHQKVFSRAKPKHGPCPWTPQTVNSTNFINFLYQVFHNSGKIWQKQTWFATNFYP